MLAFICLCGIIPTNGQMVAPIKYTTYLQEIKTDMQLPEQAGTNVVKLFSSGKELIAVTSNGVFNYRNGQWTGNPFGSGWRTAAMDTKGDIWLASLKSIKKADFEKSPRSVNPSDEQPDTRNLINNLLQEIVPLFDQFFFRFEETETSV